MQTVPTSAAGAGTLGTAGHPAILTPARQLFPPGELRWAAGWSLAALLLSGAPYVVAWLLTPPDHVFTGILSNPLDGFSYLAKMRAGASEGWLIQLPYTDPHRPALLFPQYVLLGNLAALSGLPPVAVYHAGRLAAVAFLLAMLYALAALAALAISLRRTAFLLAAFGGGLSWLTAGFGFLAADVTIPESNNFHAGFTNAHFPLAIGLLTGLWSILLVTARGGRRVLVAPGTAANLAILLLQPFVLALETPVAAGWVLLLRFRGLFPAGLMRGCAIAILLPLAPAGLLAVALYSDPALAQWQAQNVTPSPSPWSYLAGYGLLAPLAAFGAGILWLRPGRAGLEPRAALLLLAWVIAGALAVYAPVPWQRRLSEGYHLPVSILAAVGLHAALGLLPRRGRGAAAGLVIGVAAIGTVFLATGSVLGALAVREPHYLRADDVRALDWLAANGRNDDRVVAPPAIGNIIPAWSDARVYWGHPFETLEAAAKESRLLGFYDDDASHRDRCEFLAHAGATLVYQGGANARTRTELSDQPGLALEFRSGPVAVYRVMGCPAG